MTTDRATHLVSVRDYSMDCGATTVPSASDALASLLPLASVNWSGALEVPVAADSALYAFRVNSGGQRHTAYVSAATGHLLLDAVKPDSGEPGSVWPTVSRHEASELGTFCEPKVQPGVLALDPSETLDLAFATQAVYETGLLQALKSQLQDVSPLAVTALDDAPTQYLVFISAFRSRPPK